MAQALPPMVLGSGQLVADLLGQAQAIRRRAMHVFAKLEDEHMQEHGRSMLESWALQPENYKDFLNVLVKLMPKEAEAAPPGVEDMWERLKNAKVIDESPPPSSLEEPS